MTCITSGFGLLIGSIPDKEEMVRFFFPISPSTISYLHSYFPEFLRLIEC
jgi:hypothetical protein